MRKALRTLALVCTGSMMLATSAHAALITSDASITDALVINFDSEATAQDVIGPVEIGDDVGTSVTVESSSQTNGLYFHFDGWVMVDNGDWGQGRTYVSLNGSNDVITFAFNDGPVSAVGGQMSYARPVGVDLVITALDAGMNVLESYNITQLADIVQPAFNGSEFRGIQRASADIAFFQISGGIANALDDLTFTSNAQDVSEPHTLLLLGLGVLGIGVARRQRKS